MAKNNIDKVLEDLKFSKAEKEIFLECIRATMLEQSNDSISADELIMKKVEELVK